MKLFNIKNTRRKLPADSDYLDEFFELIIDFLTNNKLENNPKGFKDKEISNYETSNSIRFPKAYRLFLSMLAKSDLRIFDGQDFSIEGLKDAQEVSKELQEQDKYKLSENQFAFTQWQGYNFYYLDLEMENPNVELYIEAGCASADAPPEIHKYGQFTDWLCKKIEISLNLRRQLEVLEIDSLLNELNEIKKAGNKIYSK
jgi:hypothetical protein